MPRSNATRGCEASKEGGGGGGGGGRFGEWRERVTNPPMTQVPRCSSTLVIQSKQSITHLLSRPCGRVCVCVCKWVCISAARWRTRISSYTSCDTCNALSDDTHTSTIVRKGIVLLRRTAPRNYPCIVKSVRFLMLVIVSSSILINFAIQIYFYVCFFSASFHAMLIKIARYCNYVLRDDTKPSDNTNMKLKRLRILI